MKQKRKIKIKNQIEGWVIVGKIIMMTINNKIPNEEEVVIYKIIMKIIIKKKFNRMLMISKEINKMKIKILNNKMILKHNQKKE